ncbi:hypothetical protein [Streptomyces sp. NPDC056512]|uniref:hypothetical protein n=1 Tax=Streptomyces sp. NPDC056512 TaxID=3345846 RepID=UPI00368F113D
MSYSIHIDLLPAIDIQPDSLIAWEGQPLRVTYSDSDGDQDAEPETEITLRGTSLPTPALPNMGVQMEMKVPRYTIVRVLPEHYAVCAQCGHLAPCDEVGKQREERRRTEQFIKVAELRPGDCHFCGEEISHRARKVRHFRGPNLIAPHLGHDTAVFHGVGECIAGVRSYEILVAMDVHRLKKPDME